MRFYQLDSFTDKLFKGNPAAICILKEQLSTTLMQNIAMEMNLSETAFIRRIEENIFSIRFFTPTEEVDLCGHATLAAGKVVHEVWAYKNVIFNANMDMLEISIDGEYLEMIFPKSSSVQCLENKDLLDAVGILNPVAVSFSEKIFMKIIECETEKELVGIKPDFGKLLNCKNENGIKGLAVTCKSSNEIYDFTSRCFWPWIGINEDPVTGAAHTALGPYWGEKLAKKSLKAFQASRRGGSMDLVLDDDEVHIKGQARLVMKGKIFL